MRNIDQDRTFMQEALRLAAKGMGGTSPNPMVGAVIVKSNKVVGRGFHKKAGLAHAEVNAVLDALSFGESVEGSTLYVTLEPCCHLDKRTPPCTELILEKKIKRVVIACLDPNPKVSGKGVRILQSAGVEVEVGILESESRELNKIFFKNIKESVPYVHLKVAQTLDGKIATLSGDSKWITNEDSRKAGHLLRYEYDAILIGQKTLKEDNPSLTIRYGIGEEENEKKPIVIIIGKSKNLDFESNLLKEERERIILITDKVIEGFHCILQGLEDSLPLLYKMGVCSILVEGGGALVSSVLEKDLYDEISFFVAPKIIGKGLEYYRAGHDLMKNALSLNPKIRVCGDQVIYEVKKCSPAL